MTETIIPFPTKGANASALANLDLLAAELLAAGEATTLSAARITSIQTRLKSQREEIIVLIEEMDRRDLTKYSEADTINANLRILADHCLNLIGYMTACAGSLVATRGAEDVV